MFLDFQTPEYTSLAGLSGLLASVAAIILWGNLADFFGPIRVGKTLLASLAAAFFLFFPGSKPLVFISYGDCCIDHS